MTDCNQKKGIAVSIMDKAGLGGMERADEQNCGPIMDGTEVSVFSSYRKLCKFKTYDSKYFSPLTSPKLFTLFFLTAAAKPMPFSRWYSALHLTSSKYFHI